MGRLKSIVYISAALAIAGCGDNDSVQSNITKAEQSINENQTKSAIISLKNALKVDAKNARARFLLGSLYLASGDADNAVKELERANKFKYDPEKVIPQLARAYMLVEADDDILALSEQAKNLSAETQLKFLSYKTMAALRLDDETLANETLLAAQSISKSNSSTLLAEAYVEFANKNIDHANAIVERILSATTDNADVLMLQGQLATADKNYKKAIVSFKKYLKLQPNSGKVQLFIADSLVKTGQFSEAENMADKILEKVPNQPFFQYIKAVSRFEEKDYKAASDYARSSISSGFNSFSLKLVAGASAFYLKNYEQCHLYLSELLPYLAPDHNARRMLAVSQLKLGLVDEISETLNNYKAADQGGAQFLSSLSYQLYEVGATEKAREMANLVESDNSKNAVQNVRSGILKLMMNDPSGMENLEVALQINPDLLTAELALAFASLESGDIDRAREIANKWIKKYPEKAGGYNLLATIALKLGKNETAESELKKSLEIEPNNVYALTEMVKLAYQNKNLDLAKKYSKQALSAHPDNLKVLTQYFELHKDVNGLAVVQNAEKAHKDDMSYGLLLAESLMKLEKYKQAEEILVAFKPDAKTPNRYWQLLLVANRQKKEPQDMLNILDKWREISPYQIEPILLKVNYWVDKKLPDRALNVLKNANKQHSNNVMLLMVEMQVLLDNAHIEKAKTLRNKLKLANLNQDMLAGIDGRILILEKNYSAAVPKLKQFYKAKPSTQGALYLAFVLEKSGKPDEAISLLENYSSKYGESAKIQLTLANMYLREAPNKAIHEYEKLILRQPDNVVALNNLSWLYMEKNQFDQALKYSEKAYKLSNNVASVVDTYAQTLLKSGELNKALIKAKEAFKLSKAKDVDIALNYVEALTANNKIEQAKSIVVEIDAKTAAQKDKKEQLESKL